MMSKGFITEVSLFNQKKADSEIVELKIKDLEPDLTLEDAEDDPILEIAFSGIGIEADFTFSVMQARAFKEATDEILSRYTEQ